MLINRKNNSTKKSLYIRFAYLFFAIILLVPTLIGLGYVVPTSDDFANASLMNTYRMNHSYLGAAIAFDKDIYLNHQGTYFGCLLVGLLPSWKTTYYLLRMFLIVGALLLVISSSVFLMELCKNVFQIRNSLSVYVLMLISEYIILNTANYSETLTWFNGSCLYCYPLVCFFGAASLILKYMNNKNRSYIVFAAILGFCGSGASLMVVGFGCWLLLVLSVLVSEIKRRERKPVFANKELFVLWVPFISALVGALINVAAPGNYLRHDAYVYDLGFGETTILSAVRSSIIQTIDGLSGICHGEYAFAVVLAVAFISVILSNQSMEIRVIQLVFATVLSMLFPVICCFPIFLGEGIASLGELRTIYMFQVALELGLVFIFMLVAAYVNNVIRKKGRTLDRWLYICSVSGLFAIILLTSSRYIDEGMTARMTEDLLQRNIQKNTAAWDEIYHELYSMDNQTELIELELLEESIPNMCMKQNGLSDDPSFWVNNCIATYYGHKGSFVVK